MTDEELRKFKSNMKPDCVIDDEKLREPIVKLGQLVTNRSAKHKGREPITKDDPEYWGLAAMLSDEEAELALQLGIRQPKTFDQIRELTGIRPRELKVMLDHMSEVGVLEYNWENLDGKNPDHEKKYVLPIFVPGIGEFANMNEDLLKEHPEEARFFERMAVMPMTGLTHLVPPGGAGLGMHVIPVEDAISMEDQSVPVEHISHWLDKYDGKYAASPCSCRLSRSIHDENAGDDFHDWCIAVGDMADYVVETNKGGRYITKEEALEILQKAEDNGFVHEITNIDGENKIFAICNCNVNVCYALRMSQLFNTPNLNRSAYVAKVDKDKCVACGRCVEYCPAGAVKLGRKLCYEDGAEPVYPRQELPKGLKWGPEKWNLDYKNTNRKNCWPTGTAPCKTACPAHIAIQGYLKLAAQGKYTEALELIKRENPFPAVCGRICNRKCEEACTRGTVDQAVAIDEVKRFIAQRDLDAETRFIAPKVIPKVVGGFDQKIAVIGGGPAGLSCAYYLAQMGYEPTVFEKNEKMGGMMEYGIPNFRLEKDVVQAEIDILQEMGVKFRNGVEIGKDITIGQLRDQGYEGFYIAIGLQYGGRLGVPGDDAEGVIAGSDFMRKVNAGSDVQNTGRLSGNVVVIGGGNIASDVARTAVRCGADHVSMYCLEAYEDMPCGEEDRSECEREGIEIHAGWGQTEIVEKNGRCAGIRFRKCLSVKDSEGHFAPEFDDSQTCEEECTTVLFCIGQKAEWKDLLKDTNVRLSKRGLALADGFTYQTDEPDIFVGGDAFTGQKFVIDAIAAGKEAAMSLHRFVQPHSDLTVGRNRRDFHELDKENYRYDEATFDNTPRQQVGYNDALRKTFQDGRIAFTEEQVKKETARCLSCGQSVVDPNKCIGCGVCTTKCAFDAIHIHRERPECSRMSSFEERSRRLLPYVVKKALHLAKN
jgi:NADPH-dependent glutamate synthase beta subunit-like oxidoreductase/formate hydrogenlyase subunit 6/NADH:ubiquinone oxidoreductase subunit I